MGTRAKSAKFDVFGLKIFMSKAYIFLWVIISSSVQAADFPPFVEAALSRHDCEDYDRFNEVNETSEYPFQYGYGHPETVIVWCKWRVEGHLLILPSKDKESALGCPNEVRSKYISAGGLSLVNEEFQLSRFSRISYNLPLEEPGMTEGLVIHSNWAGAGTYLYCFNGGWVYFNHD